MCFWQEAAEASALGKDEELQAVLSQMSELGLAMAAAEKMQVPSSRLS